jgi:hypothetical protein
MENKTLHKNNAISFSRKIQHYTKTMPYIFREGYFVKTNKCFSEIVSIID